ncbi:MAG: D-alanyl-D-alanine carboxypeptidase family protein [Labilithrix sp.]|nr:D-alanyl-D-alanine carboxypeptidase family protein [Labilithrix sp.]
MLAHRLARVVALSMAFGALACSGESPEPAPPDHHEHDDGPVGSTSAALVATDPVSAAVTQSCSTTSVKGLATQLVEEIQCLRPNTFARIDKTPGLALGAAVFPYLQTNAATALVQAQKARNVTMTINSALRTLPQQYLLHRWYQTGRCGIGLAASPGRSNHESAVAIDINDNAAWRSALQGKSFRWLGASDPVHYDFVGGGTVDLRGLSVRAFQRLWNRNHPTDRIAEDGDYGPATAARLAQSPVGGFVKGADCSKSDAGADAGDAQPLAPLDVPVVPDATEPTTEEAPPAAGSDLTSAPLPASEEDPPAEAAGCAASPAPTKTSAPEAAWLLGLVVALHVLARRYAAWKTM